VTTRYIAMVPVTESCTECDGSGWIGPPYAAGSVERSAWSLGDCAACEGKGNIVGVGDEQPAPERLFVERDAAKAAPYGGATSVLAVNLDDLERVEPPESHEERYQRCERIMLAAAAEVERLRPHVEQGAAEPPPPTLPVSHVRLSFKPSGRSVFSESICCVEVLTQGAWIEVGQAMTRVSGQTMAFPVSEAAAKRGTP
jgi:hypothetical protein